MRLLIDAGNTRIKWAVVDGARWVADGALAHDQTDALRHIAADHAVAPSATGVNVAGPAVGASIHAALGAAGVTPQWLRSSAQRGGVHNLYDDPTQLGADRWAALIGARAHHRGPCLVVSAGTATTVDLLASDGRFLGGLILPGEWLMRRALARDTAQLPLAEGEPQVTPRNTVDAIVTGCLYAQVGAIERMFRHIADQPDARCLLAGGAADRLRPLLDLPCERVDHLVLRGLTIVSVEDAA